MINNITEEEYKLLLKLLNKKKDASYVDRAGKGCPFRFVGH